MFETKTKTKTKGSAGEVESIGSMDGTEVEVKTKSSDVDRLLKEAQKLATKTEPVASRCGCWG